MNLVAVSVLCLGVLFFVVGMHIIDNAWNLKYVQQSVGGEWFDNSLLVKNIPPEKLYDNGVMIVFISYIFSVIVVLYLCGITNRKK